jgi:hypothetical protein
MRIWKFLEFEFGNSAKHTSKKESFWITNHSRKNYKLEECDKIHLRWNDDRNTGIYVKYGNTIARKQHDIWFNAWSPG